MDVIKALTTCVARGPSGRLSRYGRGPIEGARRSGGVMKSRGVAVTVVLLASPVLARDGDPGLHDRVEICITGAAGSTV